MNNVNERYLNWLSKNKTVFPLEKRVNTSFNLGELTPLGFFEGLPGDTFNFKSDSIIRIASPLTKPTMETISLHYTTFAVPMRLVYENWKKLMGERDDYEKPDATYVLPQIQMDGKHNYAKSILSYFGVPIPNAEDKQFGRVMRNMSKALSNAYALIHNNHFRDQNLQHAKEVDISDNDILFIGENDSDSNYHTSAPDKYTGKLASVNRNFDYFSNAFTDTQKGEQVIMSFSGSAPVITKSTSADTSKGNPLTWTRTDDGNIVQGPLISNVSLSPLGDTGITPASESSTILSIKPRNLFADLSKTSAFSINDLRELEKLQQRKELDLVAGTQYFEIVDNYFGVKNVLGLLDYPQQLSYSQGRLDISQVVQTSGTATGTAQTTPQGNVAGYGVDTNQHSNTVFTCSEHCMIIPFVYATQNHRYQQGIDKFFNRLTKDDFFDPTQIGRGFQPIYKSEIYGHLKDSEKDDIWAYAPSNERYRKNTDIITGQMNVNAEDSLSTWHAGDVYKSPPKFDTLWKIETPIYLDNCLKYPSSKVDNFLLDITFSGIKVSTVDPLGVPYI